MRETFAYDGIGDNAHFVPVLPEIFFDLPYPFSGIVDSFRGGRVNCKILPVVICHVHNIIMMLQMRGIIIIFAHEFGF